MQTTKQMPGKEGEEAEVQFQKEEPIQEEKLNLQSVTLYYRIVQQPLLLFVQALAAMQQMIRMSRLSPVLQALGPRERLADPPALLARHPQEAARVQGKRAHSDKGRGQRRLILLMQSFMASRAL